VDPISIIAAFAEPEGYIRLIVTRGVVMALAAGDGLPVTACALTPYDLYTADECFLTGTGAELIPVREVDGRPLLYCPGPVFSRLAEAFADRVARETQAG